jgi:hypothetical protein
MEAIDEAVTVSLRKRGKLMPRKRVIQTDPFSEVFGMWVDRNIDAATLRKQAWGIEN